MELQVRHPVVGDERALAQAHVRAWKAAYKGLMPDELLNGLSVEERAQGWRARIEGGDGSGVLVGLLDGEVVGFAAFGRCRDEDDQDLGELFAINLDPDAWGVGLGRRLFRDACHGLGSKGFENQVLWVAGQNERARRLYDSEGWAPDGHSKSDAAHGAVREIRYRRPAK